jgi:hypothetical protein
VRNEQYSWQYKFRVVVWEHNLEESHVSQYKLLGNKNTEATSNNGQLEQAGDLRFLRFSSVHVWANFSFEINLLGL